MADGLKTEVEFKGNIEAFIAEGGGSPLQIEQRMLASIDRAIANSEHSESQIRETPKLSNLADLIGDLGHHRVVYVVGQKIGSHHVHGTWPSLRMHYLEENRDGFFGPRDHDCQTHVNQYVFVPLVVLHALMAFSEYVCSNAEDARAMKRFVESIVDEIERLNAEVVGTDFELVTDL